MRLVRDLAQVRPAAPSSVTVGVFDGVHRGHQQIIAGMVAKAHAAGRVAAAYTFDPHPAAAMGREAPLLLTTLEERAEILSALGLDILVVPPFTPTIARTGAADFVDLLVRHVAMVELWVGPDFALGYKREGDIPFLRHLGAERGFTVCVVEPMMCDGDWVSSSRIRDALSAGNLAWATKCLGRPYRLAGTVIPGSGLTAVTVAVSPDRLLPAKGAYACLAHGHKLDNRPAVAYVRGPIHDPGCPRGIEVHLVDVGADVEERYRDQMMAIDFVARLWDEAELLSQGASRRELGEDARRALVLLGAAE